MVKNNSGSVEAYQWSSSTSQWMKLGEVVDAVNNPTKQLYDGKEYDYVFDVEIQAGAPSLKLPYNVSGEMNNIVILFFFHFIDNPYAAAQSFIDRNELSQDFLDQIATFIMNNTQGASIGTGPAPQSESQQADPYTGSGRYIPGTAPVPVETGVSPQTVYKPPVAKVIPMPDDGYIVFNQGNLAAIRKKLLELSDQSDVRTVFKGQTVSNFVEHVCECLFIQIVGD
jgi:phospholipase A-2-activating protein